MIGDPGQREEPPSATGCGARPAAGPRWAATPAGDGAASVARAGTRARRRGAAGRSRRGRPGRRDLVETSGPILVMSPAPMVSTRSPGWASAATTCGTSAKSARTAPRRPAPRRRPACRSPPAPGPPAPRTRRAPPPRPRAPSAAPNSAAKILVRLNRCGWKTAMTRPPRPVIVARRAQVGGELGRVVRVGVEHPDAAGLALGLEPPRGAAVAGQGRRGPPGLDPELHGGGEGGGRVQRVVLPGHAQREDQDRWSRTGPAALWPADALVSIAGDAACRRRHPVTGSPRRPTRRS